MDDVYYAGSHGMDIMAPPKPPTTDGKHHLPVNRKVLETHKRAYSSFINNNLIIKFSQSILILQLLAPQGNEGSFQPAKKFLPSIQEVS